MDPVLFSNPEVLSEEVPCVQIFSFYYYTIISVLCLHVAYSKLISLSNQFLIILTQITVQTTQRVGGIGGLIGGPAAHFCHGALQHVNPYMLYQ